MINAKDLTDQTINRAKNLQEFVVQRPMSDIPLGHIKFDVQHTAGTELANIFVYALTKEEAEQLVDQWFNEEEQN